MNFIIQKIAETDFVRKVIEEQADLAAFKEKPGIRVIVGVSAIGISYIIGWPAVSALGAMSIYLSKPLIIAIGGPITYGLSHLVFIFGMYLAGARYSKIFFKWLTRVVMEKLIKGNINNQKSN